LEGTAVTAKNPLFSFDEDTGKSLLHFAEYSIISSSNLNNHFTPVGSEAYMNMYKPQYPTVRFWRVQSVKLSDDTYDILV
jgi:hypothetical protein